MDIWQYLAAAAAIGVAVWPQVKEYATVMWHRAPSVPVAPQPQKPDLPQPKDDGTPAYMDCIYYLAEVREYLRGHGTYDDAKKAAIDLLTLALGEEKKA
jgi:hypothetical protein